MSDKELQKVTDAEFIRDFIRTADMGFQMGWHERNGGNLSYRMKPEERKEVEALLSPKTEWIPIGANVPELSGESFVITGTGRFFQNVLRDPEHSLGIIELDDRGENYRILWGLCDGGRPTSELPTHLLNHQVKKLATGGACRVIYHSHPENVIALTFVLPPDGAVYTRQLWEMMTECPLIFPLGIGVLPWMVPGGREIGEATAELMKDHNAVIWSMHGIFCAGSDFDETFGMMHAIEKSAAIFIKVLSLGGKRQTIETDQFRALSEAFGVSFSEEYLSDGARS